jgi:hypothetical protein
MQTDGQPRGVEQDIISLAQNGVIQISGAGDGIARLRITIENKENADIVVIIKPGTYFVSRGNYQNMASREFKKITIPAFSIRQIFLSATCINAGLPIPESHNTFVEVKAVSDALGRFFDAAKDHDAMTIQAGAWAITDRLNREEIRGRLVVRKSDGTTEFAISHGHVDNAWDILKSLKISNNISSPWLRRKIAAGRWYIIDKWRDMTQKNYDR